MWQYLGGMTIGIFLLFTQPLLAADIKKADVLKITDGDTEIGRAHV